MQRKIVSYWSRNKLFWPTISVLQASVSNKTLFFFLLLSHSWDLDPTGSDPGIFPLYITSSVNQDGIHELVVNCLSFYSCQTVLLFQWLTFLRSSIPAKTLLK